MAIIFTDTDTDTGPAEGSEPRVLVDEPAPFVRRITLNRPAKRNAIDNALRTQLFGALMDADGDPGVRVSILRGAGPCFSSGYDLSGALSEGRPYFTPLGDGTWSRHVSEGWFWMWDLAKPVIAQVHGYALAGGTELATACDLVYVADDVQLGYPVVRVASPPDMQFHPWLVGLRRAMELMLTGNSIGGREAVEFGFANRSFPPDELEARVLEIAGQVARIPSDLQQINKRSVHRAMDAMGIRTAIRAGSELQGLAGHQESVQENMRNLLAKVKEVADVRDDVRG
jgi:enoyl-CoA hydratase